MRGAGRDANVSFLPAPLIRLGADAPIHLLPQGEKDMRTFFARLEKNRCKAVGILLSGKAAREERRE
jgi:hypothetical protein